MHLESFFKFIGLRNEIPDTPFFTDMLRLLESSFGDGLKDNQYFALLYILRADGWGQKNLADVASAFSGREWGTVYNDVLGIDSKTVDESLVEKLRYQLNSHGYQNHVAKFTE